MVYRCDTFRDDKGIVVLQSLKVSHLSIISSIFYESSKLKNWMCELCTFSQIWSHLRERDVNHRDKQNFDAVLRIVSTMHLLKKIPEALGTCYYVEIIQNTVDSFLDKSLAPLERIEKIWYATFFVRYWRQWVILSKSFTLKNNFITQNAYLCIELNAHSLIQFLRSVRYH